MEPPKQGFVAATEHADTLFTALRGVDEVVICTSAGWAGEILCTNERVKAQLRREHLDAVVAVL